MPYVIRHLNETCSVKTARDLAKIVSSQSAPWPPDLRDVVFMQKEQLKLHNGLE